MVNWKSSDKSEGFMNFWLCIQTGIEFEPFGTQRPFENLISKIIGGAKTMDLKAKLFNVSMVF